MKKRGQAVRDRILDTAEQLFHNQGYHQTGINKVIDEADIAKASLYKHFSSKTELLIAYINRFNDQWFSGFDHFIKVLGITEPKEKLLALFDYRSDRQFKGSYNGCALIKVNDELGISEPEVLLAIQTGKHRFRQFIFDLVSSSHHRSLMNDEELSEMIYLLAEGAIVTASIFKNIADLQDAKRIVQKLL